MTTVMWVIAVGFVIWVISRLIIDYARNYVCMKYGHEWQSSDNGWYCNRCKHYRNVGDHM